MKKLLWVLALVVCVCVVWQSKAEACSVNFNYISWPDRHGYEHFPRNTSVEISCSNCEEASVTLTEKSTGLPVEIVLSEYQPSTYKRRYHPQRNLKAFTGYSVEMKYKDNMGGIQTDSLEFVTNDIVDLDPPNISDMEVIVDIEWIDEDEEVYIDEFGCPTNDSSSLHYSIAEALEEFSWVTEENVENYYLSEHYHVRISFEGVVEDSNEYIIRVQKSDGVVAERVEKYHYAVYVKNSSGTEQFTISFEDRLGHVQKEKIVVDVNFNQADTTHSITKIEGENGEGFGINSAGCSLDSSATFDSKTILVFSLLLISLIALSVARLNKVQKRSGRCFKRHILFFLMVLFTLSACDSSSKVDEVIDPPFNQKTGVLKTEAIDLSTSTSNIVSEYRLDALDIKLQVPQYSLPLKSSKIANFTDFNSKLSIGEDALWVLSQNGFIVIENSFNSKEESITDPYETIKDKELPVFITADSLLHLYHIQFDETLRIIEEDKFYDMIWDISKGMVDALVGKYHSAVNYKEKDAIKMAIAYFSVPLELMTVEEGEVCEPYDYECSKFESNSEDIQKYQFNVPSMVSDIVSQEINLMDAHLGFSGSPLFKYQEDYSQYVPRGHYTRSLKLEKYFRSLMWFGRMTFLLKGCDGCFVSEDEARLQTKTALIITKLMENNSEWLEAWRKIYEVTAFYVGFSDDLGPNQYKEVSNAIFGGDFLTTGISVKSLDQVVKRLAAMSKPKIYSGTGACEINITEETPIEQAKECLEDSAGFRFMGQRFIPDSYMFTNLVYPYAGMFEGTKSSFTTISTPVGNVRGFPRGLDVLAVLGSENAKSWLDKLMDSLYTTYEEDLAELKDEFDSLSDEEWNQNLYWSWLFALKPFMKEYSAGYPTFMQTSAWLDKTMNTTLASWAELRHDTILYAKQSYTPIVGSAPVGGGSGTPKKPVVGYVEPVPEFYNRLLAVSQMTIKGLISFDLFDSSDIVIGRLESLSEVLERLRDISIDELENRELTEEDYSFIKHFGEKLNNVIAEVEDDSKKTTIVGDVHTDGNSQKVLEEAVGYVKLIVVAYKVPDGRVLMGVGPVMSYYEFKHPMNDRLTDEKWREMLETNPPVEPEWTRTYDDDLSDIIVN